MEDLNLYLAGLAYRNGDGPFSPCHNGWYDFSGTIFLFGDWHW